MTPLHIHLMLHFYAIAEPYIPAPRASTAATNFTRQLVGLGMIEAAMDTPSGYRCTDRGRCYVEGLKAVPLPESDTIWRIPT